MKLTGAEILIETLVQNGVDTVFGYPGGAVLNIYDELYKNAHRITHVLSAHEQGAAHAADGYARVSGKTGVVIATSGPGATNLVTGIANAYLDSVPMVAITGNVATPLLGCDSFQEVDIVGITQPVVKHNFIVRDVRKLESTLNKAFCMANAGRKGPVLVDIPKNVQMQSYEYTGLPVVLRHGHPAPKNDFEAVTAAIRQCKRPLIYSGGGVVAAGAGPEVLALSQRLGAPVALSMMGLTAVPASNPLNLGMCGMHGRYASSMAQAKSDLILAVGVRFSDRATGDTAKYAAGRTIIHIDIDAAEIGKNVPAKLNLCGDVKELLTRLLEEIPPFKNEAWLAEVEAFKQAERQPEPGTFSPPNIIRAVQACCDEHTVIATDVGQHQMWVMQHYRFERPRTLVTSGGLGTMGYGLGAAIGGSIANGRKPTVLFTSDGSFGMNLNELATVVSQQLPVTVVILNNGVLGMVRQWQTMFYEQHYSHTTLNRQTDFPLLAKAFGAQGNTAKTLDELTAILANGLPSGPCVIDCHIDMDERVLPMIPPGGSVNEIVVE